jgi:hypothetical protein
MKRVVMLVFVCVCLVVPGTAYANDGGWWDWLWKWDAKFMGVNGEIHLLCLDKSGNRLPGCESWFKNVGRGMIGKKPKISVPAEDLKHQIDFRFGYYWNHGPRYDAPDPPTDGKLRALKLMATYTFHKNRYVAFTGGSGLLPVWGDRFDGELRGILSGGMLFHIPKAEWLTVRPELSLIPGGFTGADFGDPGVSWAHDNIVNFSVGIGIDLRRIR